MRYRRSYQPGGCYFFTVVTHQRQPILTIDHNIDRLRAAFQREQEKCPFNIDAIVILPDHLHTVWTLPEGDCNYSGRWNQIKRYFSIGSIGTRPLNSRSRYQKREKAVWQRRFWEHAIRDEQDWRKHIDYIHFNPVKHGYVQCARAWPYSSFGRCVRRGWYSENWGLVEPENIKDANYE